MIISNKLSGSLKHILSQLHVCMYGVLIVFLSRPNRLYCLVIIVWIVLSQLFVFLSNYIIFAWFTYFTKINRPVVLIRVCLWCHIFPLLSILAVVCFCPSFSVYLYLCCQFILFASCFCTHSLYYNVVPDLVFFLLFLCFLLFSKSHLSYSYYQIYSHI
jgi:hypothetical protein